MPRFFSLEIAAAIHAGALLVFASWALGGSISWAAQSIAVVGSGGILVTIASIRERRVTGRDLRALHWLWPLGVFNALVLLSASHPLFRIATIEGGQVLIPRPGSYSQIGSADPGASLLQLWLFDAIYFCAFNLAFAVRTRRILRIVVLVTTANAVLLAVFGTLQKLVQAPGIFFGQVASSNVNFFASFIYRNHWGAFVILMTAACLGLVFHDVAHREKGRNFWHSPSFGGLVAILFLAATVPLSGSRSCTLLIVLLLASALIEAGRRLSPSPSSRHKRVAAAHLLLAATVIAAAVAIYALARPIINARLAETQAQLAGLRQHGTEDARARLYADTWQMARDRFWFGWGLDSYARVFQLYNTQTSVDRLPVFYADAHSDWLQSLAEVGVVGTLLRGLFSVLPLVSLRHQSPSRALPRYLLFGCALVFAYACLEFPFGSPAVTLGFWICFFAAIRLVQLEDREPSANPEPVKLPRVVFRAQ